MSGLSFSRSSALRRRFLGCSLTVLAAAAAGTAMADCTPLPVTASAMTTCTGTTLGQVTVSTSGSVVVASGALLQSDAGLDTSTLFVTTPTGAAATTATLRVDGTIRGDADDRSAAVTVQAQVGNYSYPSTRLDVTVGQAGRIEGWAAISADGTQYNAFGYRLAAATLDNSGVVAGRVYGLYTPSIQYGGFLSVNNREGGVISGGAVTVYTPGSVAAIYAPVGVLTNAGLIDGGNGAAYAFYPYGNSSLGVLPSQVINTSTGVMRGRDYFGAIYIPFGSVTIDNSGLILNDGGGNAIRTANNVTLNNRAGGVITATSGDAIITNGGTITNAGTINGSIYMTSGNFWSASVLDNTGGVINGNIVFGSADDTLMGTWDFTRNTLAGVSGRINGGSGLNRLLFNITADANVDDLAGRVVLPTNFQRLALILAPNVTATLGGDAIDGLTIGGAGRFVTTGAVSAWGPAFAYAWSSDSTAKLAFENSGQILSALSSTSDAAVMLQNLRSFTNTGAITGLTGGGAQASFYGWDSAGVFTNSGWVVGDATALSINYGSLTNSGTIVSTRGVGLNLFGSGQSSNSGAITGVTVGASMSGGTFTNSGSVVATAADGVGVSLSSTRFENKAGGVVTGTKNSIILTDGQIYNAGTLNGDVGLYYSWSSGSNTYVDEGGKLNGSLRFGAGSDLLVTDVGNYVDGVFSNITGQVDAGDGSDRLVLRVGADATAKFKAAATFERIGYELSNGAALTLTADAPITKTLTLAGKGSVDMDVDFDVVDQMGIVVTTPYAGGYTDPGEVSIISRGDLSFRASPNGWASVGIQLLDKSTFDNRGAIKVSGRPYTSPPSAGISGGALVTNSGVISLDFAAGINGALKVVNSGQIVQTADGGLSYGVYNVNSLENSGTISTAGAAVTLNYTNYYTPATDAPSVVNSGTIRSTAGTAIVQYSNTRGATITNTETGLIEAVGGTAIQTGYFADTVRNDGEIVGNISLGYGDDRLENYGSITGRVDLGDGNDTFVQWVGGSMTGVVDGGWGLDTLTIDSTGGGRITGAQFLNFERFTQIGDGGIVYAGVFSADTIRLEGGSAIVEAGTSVSTSGYVTVFSGGDGSEHVDNAGRIAGSISLGGGTDTVVNRGIITGAVALGAGDDVFTEGAGSSVTRGVDGGAGEDTYIVELAGDRTGIGARTNFERLGVQGSGRLTLALDQSWSQVSLDGASLDMVGGGYAVGSVTGGDKAEAVSFDGEIATVSLGGGDDSLTLGATVIGGLKSGGAGVDLLRFTATSPVTLTGQVSGFETIRLDGGALSVAGSLGAAGDVMSFGDGGQTLSILAGGVLNGTVDLGAGDDVLNLAAGGTLAGAVLGGAGSDRVSIDLISDLSLRGDQLQQFEILEVTGTGALNFTGGAAKFDRLITSSLTLSIASGSSLSASDVTLGAAANTVTVDGAFQGRLDLGAGDDLLRLTSGASFSGSANGGAGYDRIELALGGTDAAPIAFGSGAFTGFEALGMQSGVVSLAGDYGFETIRVSGGRLIGLAGSRIAGSVTVGQGATFGSAGTVVGDVVVNGTLSPGASPGTMTVIGNVTLASGSTSLFELTPTLSDKLAVSGRVTIAQGATLKLTGAATALTPGRRLDLIVADGGLSGAFSTIQGGEGLNLHFSQSATRLQALGLFTTNPSFSQEVSSLVTTLNTALIADKASASLVSALPALVDPTTGVSNGAALARLTPQAYASAAQLATEDGLSVIDAAREQSRFAPQTAGLFGFGQAIAGRRDLDGDAGAGVAGAKIDGAGVISGVGYGVKSAWAGAFVGYLNGRQRIGVLDARTDLDSFVVGVMGSAEYRGLTLGASVAHDRADADTRRAAPGGLASGDYKLKSWFADVNLSYPVAVGDDWAVRPSLGASYVATKRGDLVERGGGGLGLTLASETTTTWFVDGQVELRGGQAAGARVHPYASLGFRSRVGGDDAAASARLTGLDAVILATGVRRERTLGTLGAGVGYDLTERLTVSTSYAGEFGDGGRQAALVGLNWKF